MISSKEDRSLDRPIRFADQPRVRSSVGRCSELRKRRLLGSLLWFILGSSILVGVFLRWSSYLLVSNNPLPAHTDAAVVLQGSILGEKARIAGAVHVLQLGVTDRILVSIPKETYWGQAVAPIARADISKNYGPEVAAHVEFCETVNVDSTTEESEALANCINQRGWRSVVIVTSDYHTRRAGIIWKRLVRQQRLSFEVWIHGVPDPEFHVRGWWQDRRSAKTWITEGMKLAWTLAGGH